MTFSELCKAAFWRKDFRYTSPLFKPRSERAISCVLRSKQRPSNPLGKGLAVCFSSFGQLLSFCLRKPNGHDLALGFTLWQLWPSGSALHKGDSIYLVYYNNWDLSSVPLVLPQRIEKWSLTSLSMRTK